MSIVRHALAPTVLALVLAGSGCAPFPVAITGLESAASPTPAASPLATADLRGQVSMPVVAAGTANVVAGGSGNVVAAGTANVVVAGHGQVIAPGGGNVIAPGGGNVIAPGGLNYRLASAKASAELPVYGAVVVLRDPVTRQRLPWTRPAFTDEQGRFHFTEVPTDMTYMVDVTFVTGDGQAFRLLTLARAGQSDASVNWRTTAVAGTMAESPTDTLYAADPATMAPAIADLERVAATLPAEERDARLKAVVSAALTVASGETTPLAEPAAVAAVRDRLAQLGGKMAEADTLVVPEVLPAAAIAGAREVAMTVAAKDTALSQRLGTLRTSAGTASSPATQGPITQAGQMITIKPALPAPAPVSNSGTSGPGNSSASGKSGSSSNAGASGSPSNANDKPSGSGNGNSGSGQSNGGGSAGNVVDDVVDTVGEAVDDVEDGAGNVIDDLTGGGSETETPPADGDTSGDGTGDDTSDDDSNLVEDVVDTVGGVVGGTLGGIL